MEIGSELVGIRSKVHRVSLHWRQTMNFAAGVGDDNPRYLDDERPEGVVAPPMLAVALTWPLAERPGDFWDRYFPMEVARRQVHYTEHITWRRLMRPGDTLEVRGEVAAIQPHPKGTLVTLRNTATDAAGDLVFEEFAGALMRGVQCVDRGATAIPLPEWRPSDPCREPVWAAPVPIDRLAAHVYDACSNIIFPIHTSVKFARAAGLPDILLQGTATLSLAVRELLNREAAGDPARLTAISGRFAGMVVPGGGIVVRMTERRSIPDGTECAFDVQDHTGRPVVSDGVMVTRL